MTTRQGFATTGLLIPNAGDFRHFVMIQAKKNCSLHLNFYVKILALISIVFNLNLESKADDFPELKQQQAINNKKAVLAPEKFSGTIAEGYKAAQEAKDVCSKLFCYCGCDLTDEHLSLLDCFTSMHGVDCAICQEEAVIACAMKKQARSITQIQKAIDEKFSAQYPWEEPSPALEHYIQTTQTHSLQYRTKHSGRSNPSSKNQKSGHCCGH